MKKPSFVVVDFETSGHKTPDGKLDVPNQLPTEVVAIRVREGEVVGVFNSLIYYDYREHGWTDHLAGPQNHHTKEELLKGMPESIVAEILLHFISTEIFVAYNALFDLRVLYEMLKRHYEEWEVNRFIKRLDFIDPLTITRDRHPYPHKLVDMCKSYNIPLEDAHLAMDDGMALVQLVLKMHEESHKYPELEGQGIYAYLNVAGYKRQYGEPEWVPHDRTILKPQGHEIIWVDDNGSEKRPNVKPKIKPKKGVVINGCKNAGAAAQ